MNKLLYATLSLLCFLVFGFDAKAQIPEPEEGKGLVVIYRKKKFSGGAITFNVNDSDKNYGPITNGGVIYIDAEPGNHTYFSQVLSADAITVTVEENKVYYIKASVKVGYVVGRPKFKQVNEKTALKEMK